MLMDITYVHTLSHTINTLGRVASCLLPKVRAYTVVEA